MEKQIHNSNIANLGAQIMSDGNWSSMEGFFIPNLTPINYFSPISRSRKTGDISDQEILSIYYAS